MGENKMKTSGKLLQIHLNSTKQKKYLVKEFGKYCF